MNCGAVTSRLVALQDAELSPGEAVRVREHLAVCPSCRVIDARLAAVTPEPPLELPPELRARMYAQLDRALDDAWKNPAREPLPARRGRWLAWLTDPWSFSSGTVFGYGALLVLAFTWGLSNWFAARELEAAMAANAQIPETASGPAVTIPAEQFRPASWTPPEEP